MTSTIKLSLFGAAKKLISRSAKMVFINAIKKALNLDQVHSTILVLAGETEQPV